MDIDVSVLTGEHPFFAGVCDRAFGCTPSSLHKIGEGFYGAVFAAGLPKDPGRAVIKCYKNRGYASREKFQLSLLRRHSLLKVPAVYHLHTPDEELSFEALAMEFVEGVTAAELPSGYPHADLFAREMIQNLLHLHSVSNPAGFGGMDGIFPDWNSCYRARLDGLHQRLDTDPNSRMSPAVRQVAETSLAAFDRIFAQSPPVSSLTHSDYNLWNILVDPKTGHITAVIDPLEAGWADPEIDLFHLQNAYGDRFSLLSRYQRERPPSRLFPVKNAFYCFWDDVKHMLCVGWYDEARFQAFGNRLTGLMKQYL